MRKLIFQIAVIAALCLPVFAQTPVAEITNATLVGPEGITITAISSSTAVLQFGIGTTWCSTITAPKLPLLVSYVSPNPPLCPFDPFVGVAKSIVAQQQATAYTVTYTAAGSTKSVVVTVPALVPPAPKTATYKITCTATATVPTGTMPATLSLTNQTCAAVKQ